MPKDRLAKYPKPTKVLSKAALLGAWASSRDATKQSGSPGSDGQSARSFASNLDQQLDNIALQIRRGEFGFGPLRAKLISKADGVRLRLICIPNVRDRLVQRAIATNLTAGQKLGMPSREAFGFVQGRSLGEAISEVLNLRAEYPFVFETDIESFFDRIDRNDLKAKVARALGRSSLVPFIHAAIDCEVKSSKDELSKIENLGIFRGRGLRQGMPLSPLLANLALSPFDKALAKRGIRFVRYADDVVTFAETKQQAVEHEKIVKAELEKIGLSIPPLSDEKKTRVVSKFQNFVFLGREFFFSDRIGDYAQRVPKAKLDAILRDISELSDIRNLIKDSVPFHEFGGRLSRLASSYHQSYSDAHNTVHVDNEIRRKVREVTRKMYVDIFGSVSVSKISADHKKFLQFEEFEFSEEEYDDFNGY